MIDALTQQGTVATKTADEVKFDKWANKPENKAKYGNVILTINNYYGLTNEKSKHDNYLQQLLRSSAYGIVSRTLGKQLSAYANANEASRKQMYEGIVLMSDEFFSKQYLPAEKAVLIAELNFSKSKPNSIAYFSNRAGASGWTVVAGPCFVPHSVCF